MSSIPSGIRRRSTGPARYGAKVPVVEWLRFTGLERHYGARRIFAAVSGVLRDREKIALVGANGAGKSSLVRILAGVDEADAGTVLRAREARLGYLSQESAGDANATLREILSAAFERVHAEEARVRRLETELSAASEADDHTRVERLMEAYGNAREAFDRHGGEGMERQMRSMLVAFGFSEADLDRPADEFSGGQRTRAALARMLLEEPDYVILDEPTNHLDIETVRWLENFLIDDSRAALIVSHDRFFLERVATGVWELERGTLDCYEVPQGRGYSAFVAEKELRLEAARRDYESFVTEEKRQKAVIAELRTHGSHNYSHVRSREARLEKLDRVEAPEEFKPKIAVRLEAGRRATRGLALAARGLSKSYGAPLFEDLSFALARGERLALVGSNGSGKSTLLKILAGLVPQDAGRVKVSEGISLTYFSQDAEAELPAGKSAVEAVLAAAPIVPQTARALLGRLGLGGEAADKPVESFSGGERRRIMLARLMARSSDCLLLDEPTNDLDIASREALENVLADYHGAMIVISHDRYLLKRLADRIVWLDGGRATVFEGDYERFEAAQRGDAAARVQSLKSKSAERDPSPLREAKAEATRKVRYERELAACETEVARLDAERVNLELEFGDPALYDEPLHVGSLKTKLAEVSAAAEAALARWESLLENPE